MTDSSPSDASYHLLLLLLLQAQCQCLPAYQSPTKFPQLQAASSLSSRAFPLSSCSRITAPSWSPSLPSSSLSSGPEIHEEQGESPIQTEQLLIKHGSHGILCSPSVAGSGEAGESQAAAGPSRAFLFSSQAHFTVS